MMLLDVSSMNSTLTCVTPPREPVFETLVRFDPSDVFSWPGIALPTCSTEDSCDLHQLDRDFSGFHIGEIVRWTWAVKAVGTGLGFREQRGLVVDSKMLIVNCNSRRRRNVGRHFPAKIRLSNLICLVRALKCLVEWTPRLTWSDDDCARGKYLIQGRSV